MENKRAASAIAAIAAICQLSAWQLSVPAHSQTVLTGSASTSALSPGSYYRYPLILQQPTPDYANPAAAPAYSGAVQYAGNPATAVRVAPRAPYQAYAHRGYYRSYQKQPSFWHRHPMVRSATIGAGVGAGAGALTGLVTGRGVVHGALVGAGAGAGVGVIRSSRIMRRHPIARDVATGGVAGLGLGLAAGGRHAGLKGAAVGSAIGLGVGLFKHLR